jgi:hypothetical protein
LPIDLTADTPPPVSARGIADDENVCCGGDDARNDFDRPPYLPRLHETRENVRSNTPHSRTFAPVVIVAEEEEIALIATPIQWQREFY